MDKAPINLSILDFKFVVGEVGNKHTIPINLSILDFKCVQPNSFSWIFSL